MTPRIVIAKPPRRRSRPKLPAGNLVSPVIVRDHRHEPDVEEMEARGDAGGALFKDMRRQLSADPAPTPKRTPKPPRRTST